VSILTEDGDKKYIHKLKQSLKQFVDEKQVQQNIPESPKPVVSPRNVFNPMAKDE
jgi:hypothetical protein